MAGRIVLFGATGYTGELTARALVARGAAPLLAAARGRGCSGSRPSSAGWSSPSPTSPSRRRSAPSSRPATSSSRPSARSCAAGEPAVPAAIAAGAHYIDSTGEPPFIRAVFERHGAAAEAKGVGLLTAFGYDYVPGNLAGALALARRGAARRQRRHRLLRQRRRAAQRRHARVGDRGARRARVRVSQRARRDRAHGAQRARVRRPGGGVDRRDGAVRAAAGASRAARRPRLAGLVRAAPRGRCRRSPRRPRS